MAGLSSTPGTHHGVVADVIQHHPEIITSNTADRWNEIELWRGFGTLALEGTNHVLEGVYKQILLNIQAQNRLNANQLELFAELIRTGGTQNLIRSLDRFESNQPKMYLIQNCQLNFPN